VEVAVSLPPAEFVQVGGALTGRVRVEENSGKKVQPEALAAFLGGLVVRVGNTSAKVREDGLFVATAPETSGEHTVTVVFNSEAEPLARASFDVPFAAPPTATSPGLRAPAAAVSSEPYIVRGEFPAEDGLTTKAMVGNEAVPLLWKTARAAGFDISRGRAGARRFDLYDAGALIASDTLNVVTLTASSDKSELRPRQYATFDVYLEGIPVNAPGGANDAKSQTRIDYANRTPVVGRFKGRPDHFSVPIPTDSNNEKANRPGAKRSSIPETITFNGRTLRCRRHATPSRAAHRTAPSRHAREIPVRRIQFFKMTIAVSDKRLTCPGREV
jgi:hypothetical protein